MTMRVHNAEQFEELRQSSRGGVGGGFGSSPKRSSAARSAGMALSSPLGSLSPSVPGSKASAAELSRESQMKRVAMKYELYKKEQEAMQKQLAEATAESLQKQRTRKEAQFLKLEQEVENGKELAEELRAKLELQEQSRARQFARMHDEWTDGVFRALNEPVTAKVAAMDARQLTQRKYDAYQKFLDITNKKGGLFRDIIIESEYNPLQDVTFLEHRTVVDDPVKRVIRRREEEDAIARAGSDGGGVKTRSASGEDLGRGDNLDATLWSTGVFESTPYGYFHKMMSSTASSGGARTSASRVKLDHDMIEVGPEAVRREMPGGKRTDFARHGVDVRRASIELS